MQRITSKHLFWSAKLNGASTPKQLLTDSKQSPAFSQATQASVEIFLQLLLQVGETPSHCSPGSTTTLPHSMMTSMKPEQLELQSLPGGAPDGVAEGSQSSRGLRMPSLHSMGRFLQVAVQVSVLPGSQSSTGASATPSPHTLLQSAGQGTFGMAVSQ